MCGLFGFSSYLDRPQKELNVLTKALAEQATVRGIDATGIAFCNAGNIQILKDAKSAYHMNLKHPDHIRALIGHTRHATQGSEKKNYNNHPFYGRTKSNRFALAHNGVLLNDDELKKKFHLPKHKIETDSYVAVQLIEHKRALNMDSIRFMAEKIEGSFSFSILDDKENLYLVKGDSPLYVLHFPELQLFVFCSTDEILYRALVGTDLLSEIKSKNYDEIVLHEGDILKISPDGKTEKKSFAYSRSYGRQWWQYGYPYQSPASPSNESSARDAYIENLKCAAMWQGLPSSFVDEMLKDDFTLEEVEEYLYEGRY